MKRVGMARPVVRLYPPVAFLCFLAALRGRTLIDPFAAAHQRLGRAVAQAIDIDLA